MRFFCFARVRTCKLFASSVNIVVMERVPLSNVCPDCGLARKWCILFTQTDRETESPKLTLTHAYLGLMTEVVYQIPCFATLVKCRGETQKNPNML